MIPKRTIRLHGRHPRCHRQRPDMTPTNRPPSTGQARGRILLPPTRQMRIRERKNRLPRSRHQLQENPHQPYQSRRPETMATKAGNPQTSTINTRNPRIPKTLHPGLRPHRPTIDQPLKEGDHLPMDKRTHPSCRQTDRHHPQQPCPLLTRPPKTIHSRSRRLRIRHRGDTVPRT